MHTLLWESQVPFGELSLEPSLQNHDATSVSSIGTSVSWRSYVKDPKNFPLTAYDDALCDAPGQAQPLCHESPGVRRDVELSLLGGLL